MDDGRPDPFHVPPVPMGFFPAGGVVLFGSASTEISGTVALLGWVGMRILVVLGFGD